MARGAVLMRLWAGVVLGLMFIQPTSVVWSQGNTLAQEAADQAAITLQNGVTVTTTRPMNLRASPGLGSVIGWVQSGMTLPVLGRNGTSQWLFVDCGAKRGWMAGWLVTVSGDLNTVPITDQSGAPTGAGAAPATTPLPGSVTATSRTTVNIRAGPGPSYQSLDHFPDSTPTTVLGRDRAKAWLLIEYNGTHGWIARWLCTVFGDLAQVPITNASGSTTSPTPPTPTSPPSVQPTGPYTVHLTGAGSHLKGIYQRGHQTGKRSSAFSKIGDCETAPPGFLQPIASSHYNLGKYTYLSDTVDFFAPSGSFAHVGQAASNAYIAGTILDPVWSNPSICQPNETPLACEYRTHRPAIALITIRTNTAGMGPDQRYYHQLRSIVQFSLDQGVIPVLGTMPIWGPDHPPAEALNDVVRTVAREFNVPLWDFWVTAETLPGRGVNASYHLTSPNSWWAVYLTPDLMGYGMVHYNLEALEVLDAIMHQVIQS